ncbi:unnamed protein product, partial [Prorocentrum cordatum]
LSSSLSSLPRLCPSYPSAPLRGARRNGPGLTRGNARISPHPMVGTLPKTLMEMRALIECDLSWSRSWGRSWRRSWRRSNGWTDGPHSSFASKDETGFDAHRGAATSWCSDEDAYADDDAEGLNAHMLLRRGGPRRPPHRGVAASCCSDEDADGADADLDEVDADLFNLGDLGRPRRPL